MKKILISLLLVVHGAYATQAEKHVERYQMPSAERAKEIFDQAGMNYVGRFETDLVANKMLTAAEIMVACSEAEQSQINNLVPAVHETMKKFFAQNRGKLYAALVEHDSSLLDAEIVTYQMPSAEKLRLLLEQFNLTGLDSRQLEPLVGQKKSVVAAAMVVHGAIQNCVALQSPRMRDTITEGFTEQIPQLYAALFKGNPAALQELINLKYIKGTDEQKPSVDSPKVTGTKSVLTTLRDSLRIKK